MTFSSFMMRTATSSPPIRGYDRICAGYVDTSITLWPLRSARRSISVMS